tara:strand:- start:790 stop:1383 length:594 start_codon:yes stop_codon:yes gene_type:complete
MEDHKVLSQNEVNTLYKIFSNLVSVLNKNAIKWCCSGGTLLGAVRHGGLIPWDDDCDITIDRDRVGLLFWLKKYIEIDGFKLVKVGKYIKLKTDKLFIDIFILDDGQFPQRHYDSYNFIDDELYPTSTACFGDIDVNIPNQWKQYLDRTFPNWETQAVIYNHKVKGKQKITLTAEMKLPYLPSPVQESEPAIDIQTD